MRQPTVQHFSRNLLLFAVYLVHMTTVPSHATPQGTSVPQSNENITNNDLSSDTITVLLTTDLFNTESNISSSRKGNTATPIPQNSSYEPAMDNSIYESEFSDAITTSLSNFIPRNPVIRNIAPDQQETKKIEDTTGQPSKKENLRPFQLDNTIDNFISPTFSSPDSNLNEIITKLLHAGDVVEPTAFTKIMLHLHDNTNSQGEDVPTNAGETVKLLRKLSEDSEDNRIAETRDPNEDIILQISLSNSGDSMMVNWLFFSNNTEVSGFKVSYRMDNREDFDSSSLDISVRSFALHSLHEDENYVICVHAIINDTAVESSCAEWSQTSMKMVVGILAGTIFLIPCIIVMVLILYKDYKMKQKDRLQLVSDDTAACNKQLISCKNNLHVHIQSYHGEVKGVEGDKADGQTCPTEASLAYNSQRSSNRSTRDTGHENPCGHAADDSTDDDDAHGPWQRLSKQEVDMVSIPLTDELISTSPAASISSKNNITYIMIRSNSADRIIHQNTENLSPSQDSIHL